MKHFVILLASLTALTLTITGQTGIQLNDPTKIQGHWCWDLENTKVIIQMEQDLIQCDSDAVDCQREIIVLKAIIVQKDKEVSNLEQQVKNAMLLFDLESGKNTLLTDQNSSLIMDNFDLQTKLDKAIRSRTGWIIGGVVSISVGIIVTSIVIAVQ